MPISSTQHGVYTQRINAVIGYVRDHLTDDLSLDTLAQVAGFSPFHFHRLFTALTGETLSDLVTRLRLERAVHLLRATPTLPLTEAAFQCGFSSASVFSRTFKRHYGFSARAWDRQTPLKESKNSQVGAGTPRYTLDALAELATRGEIDVQLRSLPEQRLAYLRIYDAYRQYERVKEAYYRLSAWYCRNGGQIAHATLYGMSHDDPDITPLGLCRFDWCVTIPASWQAEGEISTMLFPACRIVTVRCCGDLMQEDRAFQYLFRYWLPRSRFQPANLPAMEIYRRQPAELGWETYDMDCALPIVPL